MVYLFFKILYIIETRSMEYVNINFLLGSSFLPAGVASTLQVRRHLGVRSDAIVESHQFGIVAEHGLILIEHTFHATIEHHITPHQLKETKYFIFNILLLSGCMMKKKKSRLTCKYTRKRKRK